MTQRVWFPFPLALVQLLMASFLLLDVLGRSVSVHRGLPALNLLCAVMWGGWVTSRFLLILHGHFAFVEYAYIIKIWLFCVREFPLK